MKKILLIAIIALAFLLRFYRLGDYPALNADEAAIGYNAYSLIQTGKDEHGNSWPIHFQSFNDYKPGLYFYLVLPFVSFLGLTEWAVRIPGAFLGALTVLVVYFLVKELFKGERTALISAFFLAISPWHIHFSRGGWEANAATFFITLGLWLFVSRRYTLSILSFVLSLYSYHAARIMVPLLGLGLLFIYFRQIKENLRGFVVALGIGAVLLLPLAKELLGPAGISRAAGVGLFADQGPFNRVNEQRGEHGNFEGYAAKLLHNKPVNYALAFAQNWVEHYHGEFLFLSGDDIQRNKVPETGQMYLQDFILLMAGMVVMVKRLNKKSVQVILFWLLLAPMAAALTFQSPHALRAHNMVIPLTIISAIGLLRIIKWLNGYMVGWLRLAGYIFIGVLIVWNFARYEEMYWGHMSKEYPFSSQYGVKELALYIKENENKYQKIWVTDRYDQPYILLLFYLKYDPAKFQADHALTPKDQYGFSTVRDFGKFHFGGINFDKIRPENPNTLIVGTDEEIHDEANIVKEIYGSNGYKYFQVVAN